MHAVADRDFARLSSLALFVIAAIACGGDRKATANYVEHDEPSPSFRNVTNVTAYVGDSACIACHQKEGSSYAPKSMAQSFHAWRSGTAVESRLDSAILHLRTGLFYTVTDSGGQLYQTEFIKGADGGRLNELTRRVDYVMGSGRVARSYFTQENGRLYQLPLTWYRSSGWDMSPGYDIDNARFDRVLPDRCIACHSSYPKPYPHLEGKYQVLRSGIGCERCHGPGALHVQERSSKAPVDSGFDHTIVNPKRLSIERRLDVCEQCHVHTSVSVLREGKSEFDYIPSRPLRDTWAFFNTKGSIDIVSHAARLRRSKCFIATRTTARPLECATCHDPHGASADSVPRNASCAQCHAAAALAQRLHTSPNLAVHQGGSDCVRCHMPNVSERQVHSAFTDHWIRVVRDSSTLARRDTSRASALKVEAYYPRDSLGPEGRIYTAMAEVIQTTLAKRGRAMGDAADALRDALGGNRTRSDALFLLGGTYLQVGRAADAIAPLEASIRADSTRAEAMRALAQSYLFTDRPAGQIDTLYQRALNLQPALAWIRAEYADFLTSQWRDREAEHEYRTALQEEPSRAISWFNYGMLLARQRNFSEAAEAFKSGVNLDPSLAEALSPLMDVSSKGTEVVEVKNAGAPLPSIVARTRAADAFSITIADKTHVAFLNVPANALVLIFRADGMLLTALPTGTGGVRRWDLMTSPAHPIGEGVFRATLQGRDKNGQPIPSRTLAFGIVRHRTE